MPFRRGLRAQPGSTSAGRAPIRPTQMRLPGSTGIPKCRISPPARTIPAGPTSRRSTTAEAPTTSSSSAPCAHEHVQRVGDRRLLVRRQRSGGSSSPVSAVTRALGRVDRFLRDALLQPGQLGRDQPDLQRPERMQRQRRRSLAGQRHGHVEQRAGHREGNHLDGRHHVARGDHGVVGQRADREASSTALIRSIFARVHPQQAGRLGGQVDPSGGGAAAGEQGSDERLGQPVGADVLGHVPRFEPCGDHLVDARRRAARRSPPRRAPSPCGSSAPRAGGECALIAPLASARGMGPNLTRLASWREPRRAGRRQSRRGSRARSRARSPPRCRGRPGRECARAPRRRGPSARRRPRRAAWVRREPSAPI